MMSARLNYSTKPESNTLKEKWKQIAGLYALVILSLVSLIFLMYPHHTQLKPHERVHIVNVGESLWSIASTQYGEVADEREVMHSIEQQNGIQDAGDLRVGQALKLSVIHQ